MRENELKNVKREKFETEFFHGIFDKSVLPRKDADSPQYLPSETVGSIAPAEDGSGINVWRDVPDKRTGGWRAKRSRRKQIRPARRKSRRARKSRCKYWKNKPLTLF